MASANENKNLLTLNFFSEKKQINLPNEYDSLCNEICELFKLEKKEFGNLQLKYFDSENDTIGLDNEEDFRQFSILFCNGECKEIVVDLNQDSKILRSSIQTDNQNAKKNDDIINNSNQGPIDGFLNFLRKIPNGLFGK